MDTASLKELIEAVKTLGFPIVMCLWLMWRDMKRDKEHTAALKEMTTALKEMGNAVTLQITKIEQGVDEISDGVEEISDGLSVPNRLIGALPLPSPAKEGTGK